MKTLLKIFPVMLVLFFTTACAAQGSPQPGSDRPPIAEPSTTHAQPENSAPTSTPSPSGTPALPQTVEPGPLLLLQTGFNTYQYLNPVTQASYPFEPPIQDSQFRFRANLSPSSTHMFFPTEDDTGVILDLRNGEIIHTLDHSSPDLFNPSLAAAEAEPLVTELGLNEAGLLDAVEEAHQRSRQLLHWYQSDRYHLSVQDTGPTSTSLFLEDHLTGTRLQLEEQPGLVEDYRPGPDKNLILLKKGWVFKPGAYRDKGYFLLNVEERSAQPLMLPEDVQNPSVTWFDQDTIGVTHHAYMSGVSGFSLLDIHTMQITPIIAGEFLDLQQFGDDLFFLQRQSDPESTIFHLLTLGGEPIATERIGRHCFYQYATLDRIIFQCDLESFLLDQDLTIEPFPESILILSPAPNRNAFVMTNRTEQSFLLDADLHILTKLPLEEPPLEIQWLPDSRGFIYRTHGKLYYFDVINQAGHFLLESDLFTDYTNLNAVWVTTE